MRALYARAIVSVAILSLLVLGLTLFVGAREQTGAKPSVAGGETGEMKATLVEPKQNARKQVATVQVKVTEVKLVDPAAANEQPKPGEGHLHYQLDGGPVIATTAPKLSFHELSPGEHTIVVMLAANDHTPLGPKETLKVTIPGEEARR